MTSAYDYWAAEKDPAYKHLEFARFELLEMASDCDFDAIPRSLQQLAEAFHECIGKHPDTVGHNRCQKLYWDAEHNFLGHMILSCKCLDAVGYMNRKNPADRIPGALHSELPAKVV